MISLPLRRGWKPRPFKTTAKSDFFLSLSPRPFKTTAKSDFFRDL
jgi:hypothetical protein